MTQAADGCEYEKPSKSDRRHEILMKEWDICEAGISRFNGLLFQIRSWTITAFSGILVLAFTQSEPRLLYVGSFVALAFWVKEGSTKIYEDVFIRRTHQIQQCLQGMEGANERPVPQISTMFAELSIGRAVRSVARTNRLTWFLDASRIWASKVTRTTGAMFGAMITGHSFLLYCTLIALGLVLPQWAGLFAKRAEGSTRHVIVIESAKGPTDGSVRILANPQPAPTGARH